MSEESSRSTADAAAYKKARAELPEGVCVFCNHLDHHCDIIATYKAFFLVRNRFPYVHWSSQKVKTHLMIIPKRHVLSLSELTPTEVDEWAALCAEFEGKDHTILSRSPGDSSRSVAHQHTHLIKFSP